MREYSEGFRRKMVQRLTGPHAVSATALAKEVGVAQATLSRWLLDARNLGEVTRRKDRKPSPSKITTPAADPISAARRPEDRTPQEKLRVVLEASRLNDDELGALLRREGIHEADLDAWREAVLGALSPAPGRPARSGDARRVRELERELRRKDKALAEAAALLVLQKKVQAIWGDEDDDTKPESDG